MAFARENILSGHGPQILTLIAPQKGQPVKEVLLRDPVNPEAAYNAVAALSLQDGENYADWTATGGKVRVGTREAWTSPDPVWSAEAEDVDATIGKFKFPLGAHATECPGLYLFEIVLVNKDGLVVNSNSGYLEVTPSAAFGHDRTPISVAFLRRRLRDAHPRANRVLEECEFSIAEIHDAIQDTIADFNLSPPDVGTRYSPADFPWVHQAYDGISARLFRMAAVWYARNDLKVQQAGLAADDMGKADLYVALADQYEAKWTRFRTMTKRSINISNGFGTVRSRMYP